MWYGRKEINRGSKLYNSPNIRRDRKKSQTYSILKRNRRRRRRKGGTEERIEGRKNRRKENKSIDVSGNL